jgi:hypothetical protein
MKVCKQAADNSKFKAGQDIEICLPGTCPDFSESRHEELQGAGRRSSHRDNVPSVAQGIL